MARFKGKWSNFSDRIGFAWSHFWQDGRAGATGASNIGVAASIAESSLSALSGAQALSGSIASLSESSASVIIGSSGASNTGAVASISESASSALVGTQALSGVVSSFGEPARGQLAANQVAGGAIQSLSGASTSQLAGSQSASCSVQSFSSSSLSGLLGTSGATASGFVASLADNQISTLFAFRPDEIIGGGSALSDYGHYAAIARRDKKDDEILAEYAHKVNVLPKQQHGHNKQSQKPKRERLSLLNQAEAQAKIDKENADRAHQRLMLYLEELEAQVNEDDAIAEILFELI